MNEDDILVSHMVFIWVPISIGREKIENKHRSLKKFFSSKSDWRVWAEGCCYLLVSKVKWGGRKSKIQRKPIA